MCAVLMTAVTHLSSWLEDKGLLLNSAKTQVMFIRPRCAFDTAPAHHMHKQCPASHTRGEIYD